MDKVRRISYYDYAEFSAEDKDTFCGITECTDAIVYRKNGMFHREDGPAYINKTYGDKEYYLDNKRIPNARMYWARVSKLGRALYG